MEISSKSTSIRCSRLFKNGNFRQYDIITFPTTPVPQIKMWLRRIKVIGFPQEDTGILLETLDEDNSILDEIMIDKKQFNYLRRTMHFKEDKGELDE